MVQTLPSHSRDWRIATLASLLDRRQVTGPAAMGPHRVKECESDQQLECGGTVPLSAQGEGM